MQVGTDELRQEIARVGRRTFLKRRASAFRVAGLSRCCFKAERFGGGGGFGLLGFGLWSLQFGISVEVQGLGSSFLLVRCRDTAVAQNGQFVVVHQ